MRLMNGGLHLIPECGLLVGYYHMIYGILQRKADHSKSWEIKFLGRCRGWIAVKNTTLDVTGAL